MLLYLVTKNHSFSDGNKRIAATLFLWFLNENRILYRPDGSKRLPDNTLVALTHCLFITNWKIPGAIQPEVHRKGVSYGYHIAA